jgi:hypothetical protein
MAHDLVVREQLVTWQPPKKVNPEQAGQIVSCFLDTAATSFGRATHYNTREEAQKAELHTHAALLGMDRDLYTAFLMLPGVTDRSRQLGTKNLLSQSRNGQDTFLDASMERSILARLMQEMPPQRMFKLFEGLRVSAPEEGLRKANNNRTRKLILKAILSSPRLELWAVKYRKKMRRALVHAWGERMAGIVRAILAKQADSRTPKDWSILKAAVDKHAGGNITLAYECVGFALGLQNGVTLPLFKAFKAAKSDLSKGKKLPMEVLEGIRSVYHKETPKENILKLTAKTLTKGQKLAVQKRAKAADVDVQINPLDYDPVKLYIYAFEMGLTEEISKALEEKARKMAERFPAKYGKVGILVDASRSMVGDKTQKLRPMAATLALRDMLGFTGEKNAVVYCGGTFNKDEKLPEPSGDTSLAEGLLELLDTDELPETIFVLSDGYENRPAGRFGEVVHRLKEIGIEVPIYHLNPVFAAEVKGTKELSPGQVPTLPVKEPKALGLSFLRGMLESDPVRGINALLRIALLPEKAG